MSKMLSTIGLIALIVVIANACFCVAQTVVPDTSNAPETQWDHVYGPVKGYTVIETSDDGYAIGGTYAIYQSATRGPGNFENYTAVLIKTDSSGTTQWNKTYDAGNAVNSIIQTDDGGYILSGYSENKLWLIKTDESGKVQWANTYLDPAYQTYSKVARTKDGFFLIGYRYTQNGSIIGKSAAVIVKVDSTGNLQWNKTYNENARFLDYAETGDNGLALLGISDYYGTNQRPLLMRIDKEGDVLWMKTYNDYRIEKLNSLCVTEDGGYLLAGKESASGNTGSWFALLVKTDSNGNLQWNKTYDQIIEGSDQVFLKITPASNKCYFVGGSIEQTGMALHQMRVLLIKIDDSGSILWRKIVDYYENNQPASAYLQSLTKTNDNSLVFVGTQIGNGANIEYIWAVKLAADSGTSNTSDLIDNMIWIIPTLLVITILAVAALIIRRKRKTL